MPTRTLLLIILLFSLTALFTVYHSGISLQVNVQSSASSAAGRPRTSSGAFDDESAREIWRIFSLDLTKDGVLEKEKANFDENSQQFEAVSERLEKERKRVPFPVIASDTFSIEEINKGLSPGLLRLKGKTHEALRAFFIKLAIGAKNPNAFNLWQKIYFEHPPYQGEMLELVSSIPRDDYRNSEYQELRSFIKNVISLPPSSEILRTAKQTFINLTPYKTEDLEDIKNILRSNPASAARILEDLPLSSGSGLVKESFDLLAEAVNDPKLKTAAAEILSSRYPEEYHPAVSSELKELGLGDRKSVSSHAEAIPPEKHSSDAASRYLAQLPGGSADQVSVDHRECELLVSHVSEENPIIGAVGIDYPDGWLPYGSESEWIEGDENLEGTLTIYNTPMAGPESLIGRIWLKNLSLWQGTSLNTPNSPYSDIEYAFWEDACFNIDIPENPPECQYKPTPDVPQGKRRGYNCLIDITLERPVNDGERVECKFEVMTFDNAADGVIHASAGPPGRSFQGLATSVEFPLDTDDDWLPDKYEDYEIREYLPGQFAHLNLCARQTFTGTLGGKPIPPDTLLDIERGWAVSRSGGKDVSYEHKLLGDGFSEFDEYRGLLSRGAREHRKKPGYKIPLRFKEMKTEGETLTLPRDKQLFITDEENDSALSDPFERGYAGEQRIAREFGVDPVSIFPNQDDWYSETQAIPIGGAADLTNVAGGVNFNGAPEDYDQKGKSAVLPQAALKFRFTTDQEYDMIKQIEGGDFWAVTPTYQRQGPSAVNDLTVKYGNGTITYGDGVKKVLGIPILYAEDKYMPNLTAWGKFLNTLSNSEILRSFTIHEMTHKLPDKAGHDDAVLTQYVTKAFRGNNLDELLENIAEFADAEYKNYSGNVPKNRFYSVRIWDRNSSYKDVYGVWVRVDVLAAVDEIVTADEYRDTNGITPIYELGPLPLGLLDSSGETAAEILAFFVPERFTDQQRIRADLLLLFEEEGSAWRNGPIILPSPKAIHIVPSSAGMALDIEGEGGHYQEAHETIISPPDAYQSVDVGKQTDVTRRGGTR